LIILAESSFTGGWMKWPLVAIGLGLVIFVHELGHFLVAKWCGVKVDKFFIGFDIGGWKISRRWGETEYGIGILPLGGYVKMLGQEDNPYRVREEMERARRGAPSAAASDGTAATDAGAADGAAGDAPALQLDSRSYLAKSVPQRMAIISAGVIMNVIFAFLVSTAAYALGVGDAACVIGEVFPGGAAWHANLQVGDEIIKIGDTEKPRFRDLSNSVALADPEDGVVFLIRRPGESQPREVLLKPRLEPGSPIPLIGIRSSFTNHLSQERPLEYGSQAAAAQPGFEPGDRLVGVRVAGSMQPPVPIRTGAELFEQLTLHADDSLEFSVERQITAPPASPAQPKSARQAQSQTLPITVAPMPARTVGVVMAMGKITAVQPGSPAAQAGLKEGDFISKIEVVDADATITLDPTTLPDQLRRLAGHKVNLTLDLGNNATKVISGVELRPVRWAEKPLNEGHPMSAPALGIAYRVMNRVAAVEAGSPAAQSGRIKPGDEVTAIKFIQPALDNFSEVALYTKRELSLELSPDKPNWAYAMADVMQNMLPGTKVELTIKGQEKPLVLDPVDSPFHLPRRGFNLKPLRTTVRAETFGQALSLGRRETVESLTLVVSFLRNIRRLWGAAGSFISIFYVAGASAERGLPELMIFLAMLSANLAVINILPIPVLDGGHLVFLTLEGIRGKPVSEKVFLALTYLGFAFIVCLMLFVMGLDIYRFS
jgi:regulator of sigma E protease